MASIFKAVTIYGVMSRRQNIVEDMRRVKSGAMIQEEKDHPFVAMMNRFVDRIFSFLDDGQKIC